MLGVSAQNDPGHVRPYQPRYAPGPHSAASKDCPWTSGALLPDRTLPKNTGPSVSKALRLCAIIRYTLSPFLPSVKRHLRLVQPLQGETFVHLALCQIGGLDTIHGQKPAPSTPPLKPIPGLPDFGSALEPHAAPHWPLACSRQLRQGQAPRVARRGCSASNVTRMQPDPAPRFKAPAQRRSDSGQFLLDSGFRWRGSSTHG